MKRIQDERITRQSNALTSKLLLPMLGLEALVLIVKLLLGATARLCILDIAVLALGILGVVTVKTIFGLWHPQDEALREINATWMNRIFMALFWLMLIGEFLLVFLDKQNVFWYAPTMLVWFIPALIITVVGVRKGYLVWGSKKNEQQGAKRLGISTAVGALFFGLVMGGPSCFKDGAFQPTGLVQIAALAISWGVLFYIFMRLMIKRSEKAANQAVAAAEEAADEE